MEWLNGKKTYVVSIALGVAGFLVGMGWIDADTANTILVAGLGALGITLRHAIRKTEGN